MGVCEGQERGWSNIKLCMRLTFFLLLNSQSNKNNSDGRKVGLSIFGEGGLKTVYNFPRRRKEDGDS
jgi:hypothetical protein